MRTARRASLAEAGALHAILTECGLDLERRLGLSHWLPPYPERLFRASVVRGDVYRVDDHGELAATFTISADAPSYYDGIEWPGADPALYVSRVAVTPVRQGKGLGSWCMARIEELAAERGCRSVRLDAYGGHELLLRFYRRLGYREIACVETAGRPMVCFEKEVGEAKPKRRRLRSTS